MHELHLLQLNQKNHCQSEDPQKTRYIKSAIQGFGGYSSHYDLDYVKYNTDNDISYIPLDAAEEAARQYLQRQAERQ